MKSSHLPPGVSRNEHARANLTLETCVAMMFDLEPGDSSIIVWKGNRPNLHPLGTQKRIRDIRPGDRVEVFGEPKVVKTVELYR